RGDFEDAFRTYLHTENFEMREQAERAIDTRVLACIRAQ
ncbi:putative peptidoglycan binding domain-containing protein, partial [Pseudomonas alvandae]